jgi:hypothetical protein
MPKRTPNGDPVYRCKECIFVQMGTRVNNWTCSHLEGAVVPLSYVPEFCPLDDLDTPPEEKLVPCPNKCGRLVPEYALSSIIPGNDDDLDAVTHCGCYYTGGGKDSFEEDCRNGDFVFGTDLDRED